MCLPKYCLRKKKVVLSATEFNAIAQTILGHLAKRNYNATELVNELRSIKTENVWEVLRFLQAENKIQANSQGDLALST